MDEKDIVTALIAAVASIIAAIVPDWLQTHNKEAQKEKTVDFAKQRVEFLSAWLQARQQSDTSRKISTIKTNVAEELDNIKEGVDKDLVVLLATKPRQSLVLWSLVPPLSLMKIIGCSSCALPLVLFFCAFLFGTGMQSSIGMYYSTPLRVVPIFFLCLIGICLFLYQGYQRVDRILGDFGCVSAISLALFPAASQTTNGVLNPLYIFGLLHNEFFLFFFVVLASFSLFLFTKTDPTVMLTARKQVRNQFYKAFGYLILLCVPLIAICLYLLPAGIAAIINGLRLVFWLETAAFEAAGISWLMKGQVFLKDEPKMVKNDKAGAPK